MAMKGKEKREQHLRSSQHWQHLDRSDDPGRGLYRHAQGRQQQAGAIQSQVIDALKAELETLQRRLEALEKENTRLEQTMGLIKHALRKRGLAISIDGDLVTIRDEHGGSQTGRIREER